MRIAYISQSYPPMVSGAALVIQRLAEGLAARGHQVLVMAASCQGRAYVEGGEGMQIVWLRSLLNPVRVGQRFVLWPRGEVDYALRTFNPDIVHLHDPTTAGMSGILSARALKKPIVLTVHQLPWFVSAYMPRLPGLRPLVEDLLWAYGGWFGRQCQTVVTPSRAIADIMSVHGWRPEVISNGVDLECFSPHANSPDEGKTLREKYGLDPERPIVLYVGRVDADKKVEAIVTAAAQVLSSIQAQLLVVGNGKQLDRVARLTEELGISHATHLPGFVPSTGDLPGLYRLASVFVTASEVEIQSSVVLEAAATGRPIVAVRASSMSEFVEDGTSGFLVPPGDVGAMADRIVTILRHPDQAQSLGQAALALARRHSLAESIQAHERLYESLGEV